MEVAPGIVEARMRKDTFQALAQVAAIVVVEQDDANHVHGVMAKIGLQTHGYPSGLVGIG